MTMRVPSSSSPTTSWPGTNGKLTKSSKYVDACPSTSDRSDPQMPARRVRTRCQPSPGHSGSSIDRSSSGPILAAVPGATAEAMRAMPNLVTERRICSAFIPGPLHPHDLVRKDRRGANGGRNPVFAPLRVRMGTCGRCPGHSCGGSLEHPPAFVIGHHAADRQEGARATRGLRPLLHQPARACGRSRRGGSRGSPRPGTRPPRTAAGRSMSRRTPRIRRARSPRRRSSRTGSVPAPHPWVARCSSRPSTCRRGARSSRRR